MSQFRTAHAPVCIACFLIASLLSHQHPRLTTASAELIAIDPADTNSTPYRFHNEFFPWQHTAWEHWGSPPIDSQRFPYTVVFVGDKLQNIAPDDISTAIKLSIDTWNDVTCAVKSLQFGGLRSNLADLSTDEIPIFIPPAAYWNEQQNLIASTNMNAPAIALNTAHFTWTLEPAPFQYLASNLPATSPSAPRMVDLQSVITHELGHVLGLWHTLDDATAVMTAQYLPDASQRLLAADDKFALCHLFPKPDHPAECDNDNDCSQGPCVTDGTFQVCQKSQANPGDYCALDLLHCPHGCIIDSPSTGTGYCTTHCQIDTDCPPHFQCISAQNNQPTCRLIRPESPQQNDTPANCSILAHYPAKPRFFTPLLILLTTSLWTRNARNTHRRKNRTP